MEITIRKIHRVPEEGYYHVQVNGVSNKAFIFDHLETEDAARHKAIAYAETLKDFKPVDEIIKYE